MTPATLVRDRATFDLFGGATGDGIDGWLEPGEIIVDSFAGGGGASEGITMALGRGPDIAINHDAEAIALHAANHPESRHYIEDVWKVDPAEACCGRRVGLMWLSPDCKHFSKAKGGKPVSKRVRGLAWVAVRWAVAVKPRVIILENVEEFQTWGPLGEDGRPCPAKKGLTFRRFCGRLRNLGYTVEWRELRACDYGAPTIRKRLFLIARCDGRPIRWPEPTHGKGRAQPWRTAAECIDWSIPCPSIFGRKKPLAANTQRRIAAGLKRFVLDNPRPFIVPIDHASSGAAGARPLDGPLSTITAENRHAVVAPVVVKYQGAPESAGISPEGPMPTVTANGFIKRPGGAAPLAIATPYLVEYHSPKRDGDDRARAVDGPLPTQTTENRFAVVAPYLVPRYGERDGQEPRARSLEQPAPVVVPTQNGGSLVSAFLAKHYGERSATEVMASPLDASIGTITSKDHHALVTSTLVNMRGTSESQLVGRSIEEPLPTISGGGVHAAEVRAFMVAFYGNEKDGGDMRDPMRTVTARDRFGLVTIEGQEYAIVDIGMRMLAPRELYRAQGFPDSYRIEIEYNGKPLSKSAQVRMCGNSVVPQLAAALVRANLGTRERAKVAA